MFCEGSCPKPLAAGSPPSYPWPMASNLTAMASDLRATASNLKSNGLQPKSNGLHPVGPHAAPNGPASSPWTTAMNLSVLGCGRMSKKALLIPVTHLISEVLPVLYLG